MTSLYTCITCRVGFIDGDLQRGHYKTDWHRYNLKRKVAELPPVTADTFQQKVLAQKAKASEGSEDQSSICSLCSKHFSSKNSYDNHLQSKKHKDMVTKQTEKLKKEVEKNNEKNREDTSQLVNNEKRLLKDCENMAKKEKQESQVTCSSAVKRNAKMSAKSRKSGHVETMDLSDDEDSDAESCDSWDEDAIGLEECLICGMVSSSMENNLNHMVTKHSLFIPDAEFVVDLEGLITYLGEKVGVGHLCLWCNEKGKSFQSKQAAQKHMLDKGHCKILYEEDVVYEFSDFYDYRSSYPDHKVEEFEEGAEGGIGLEDVEMEEEEEDEDVEEEKLEGDGFELVLPSGATIGHRSLLRYYKQNLPHRETNRTKAILPTMLAQYKALGWTGASGEVAQRRVKDLGYMQRMKHRHFTRLGMKANKLQKHFRDPNGMIK